MHLENVLCFAKPQSLTAKLVAYTWVSAVSVSLSPHSFSLFYLPLSSAIACLLLLLRQACRIYGIETRKSSVGVRIENLGALKVLNTHTHTHACLHAILQKASSPQLPQGLPPHTLTHTYTHVHTLILGLEAATTCQTLPTHTHTHTGVYISLFVCIGVGVINLWSATTCCQSIAIASTDPNMHMAAWITSPPLTRRHFAIHFAYKSQLIGHFVVVAVVS